MQKIINGIAIFSGVVALGIVGLGGYVFIRKDAIIDGVKSKVMDSVLGSVTPDLGGIAGDAIPDFTGPAAPLPSPGGIGAPKPTAPVAPTVEAF